MLGPSSSVHPRGWQPPYTTASNEFPDFLKNKLGKTAFLVSCSLMASSGRGWHWDQVVPLVALGFQQYVMIPWIGRVRKQRRSITAPGTVPDTARSCTDTARFAPQTPALGEMVAPAPFCCHLSPLSGQHPSATLSTAL